MAYQLQFAELAPYVGVIARGAWLTIQLTAIATTLGLVLGILGAVCRRSHFPLLSWPAAAYVEVIRNTPFLVQLFFLFFGLPTLGIKLSAEQAALLAMTVNLGAYCTEIVRAGIDAISSGQVNAGLALGLNRRQVFRHVVLPPALEKVYPSLASQFIIMLLGSSVVSQISAEELTFAANFVQSRNFRSFEVYFVATGVYLAMAIGLRAVFNLIGNRLFPHKR
jgi:polar amino acid transport system permease protein